MTTPDTRRRPASAWWRRLRLAAVCLVVLLVVLGVAGAAYQAVGAAGDARRFPPPGKLFDVGGVKLHLYCTGQGQPTVILETGLGVASPTWAAVQRPVSAKTRVCSYDRAGYGWSDSGPSPRTSGVIATELHALLTAAGERGPFILVGHSFGGLIVRVFAHMHPAETAGLVLVDSSHEDQIVRMPPGLRDSQASTSRYAMLLSLGAHLGVLRAMVAVHGLPAQLSTPNDPALEQQTRVLILRPRFLAAAADEMKFFAESCEATRPARRFGDLPLIVLTAGKLPADIPEDQRQDQIAFHRVWVDELQSDLASLSTGGRRVMVEDSTHMIPLERPDTIVTAIDEILAMGERPAH